MTINNSLAALPWHRVLLAAPSVRHDRYSQVGSVEGRSSVLDLTSDGVVGLQGNASTTEREEDEERRADELAQTGDSVWNVSVMVVTQAQGVTVTWSVIVPRLPSEMYPSSVPSEQGKPAKLPQQLSARVPPKETRGSKGAGKGGAEPVAGVPDPCCAHLRVRPKPH